MQPRPPDVDRHAAGSARPHRAMTPRDRVRAGLSAFGGTLEARPWIVYILLAILAFPILEMIVAGQNANQFAHDVFDDDVPRLYSIAADWRAFGPSLWDPHLTAGNALLAQFALPPIAPDVLMSFVFPPFVAYALNATLMAFLAGFAMHLFLRDSLRLQAVACFAGGIIASLAFWHYILGYAVLLLPLVLWTTDRTFRDGASRWSAVAAVLLVLFLALTSLIQIVALDGAIALAYVLATARTVRMWPALTLRLACLWGTAALLAAPIIGTQLAAIHDSQRSIWDLQYLNAGVLGDPLGTIGLRYASVALGVPITSQLGGSADIYGSWFPGALAIPFLAVAAVLHRPSRRARFVLAVLILLPVLDLATVLIIPIQEHFTLIRSFQFLRVRHFVPVFVAMNVAIGVGWFLRPDPIGSLGRHRRWIALGLAAAAVGAVVLQVAVASRHILHPVANVIVQSGWELADVALAGGGIVLAVVGLLTIRRRERWFARGALSGGLAVCLLFGLGAERLVFARAERAIGGQLGTWADRVAPTAGQAYIAAQSGGGRVLSIGDDANRALAAGLDAVDGYETIYSLRYHELFGAMIRPGLATDPAIARYYDGWGNRAYAFGPQIDQPLADLLGVRWLYVRGQTLTDPVFVKRFSAADVTVYENIGVFPRAFVVHEVTTVADRPALVAALGQATVDELRGRVYRAATDSAVMTGPGGPRDPTDSATLMTDTPDRVAFAVHASKSGVLVMTDTFADGWVADVDGTAATIVPADDALRGVAIPDGDHIVTFRYRPIVTLVGLAVAPVIALALAGWALMGRRRAGGTRSTSTTSGAGS